nr:hypothetical protein [uncultured Flavobacterium sp.]
MKKLFFLLLMIFTIASCSSNRVCGGSGGKRCVQTANPANSQNFS